MKKVGVFLLTLLLFTSFAIAQENETNTTSDSTTQQETTSIGVDLAYECLQDQLSGKESNELSLQEAIFSTLALGSNSKFLDKIEDEEGNNCWPKSSCALKETAQVLLAYNRINKNTEDIEEHLLSKSDTSTELTWFLQIDITNHEASGCTIKHGNAQNSITISNEMQISGNPGSCLETTSSGFWLKIKSSCLDETYQISCDQDFVTNLLYQKDGSSTIFISPETHSASSSGTTEEKVNALCFKDGSSCNYEGTLWTAYALDKTGNDVTKYMPYLLALAEDNKRFFPETLIYPITNGEDQYSEIAQSQKQNQFWQAPSTPYNKFYDTALGLLSIGGSLSQEAENAKNYLLDVQTPNGCWNNDNIRDTAFLLFSGWPRGGFSTPGDSGDIADCSEVGFCVSSTAVCGREGGQTFNRYSCSNNGVCCSVLPIQQTCLEKGGRVCSASEECSGLPTSSADSASCCIGQCKPVTTTQDQCESLGGSCESSCITGERQSSSVSCEDSSKVCCLPDTSDEEEGSSLTLWIILLAILIILVVLAIVFRKKLQLMLHRSKGKKGPQSQGRRGPPFPPRGAPPMIRRRGHPFPPRRTPPKRALAPAASQTDKELDETLKKLKEMSK